MSDPTKNVLAHKLPRAEQINFQIVDILERGKIVKFTNMLTGVYKLVNEYKPDEAGDLLAFYSTGVTRWVCPHALEYEISEIELTEEIQKLI